MKREKNHLIDWGNLNSDELEAILLALVFMEGQNCVYPEDKEIVRHLIEDLESKETP